MKWSIDCGKEPCQCCSEDWMDWYNLYYKYPILRERYIGTMLVKVSGDDFFKQRFLCEWCNGTGIERYK